MAFMFPYLTSLSIMTSSPIHVAANGKISCFLLMMLLVNNYIFIYIYIYTFINIYITFSLSVHTLIDA